MNHLLQQRTKKVSYNIECQLSSSNIIEKSTHSSVVTVSKIAAETTILNMEFSMQRQMCFLLSQSLPGLRLCHRSVPPEPNGRGLLEIVATSQIVSKAYQGTAGMTHCFLWTFSPFSLASSLAAKGLQPCLPPDIALGFVPAPLELGGKIRSKSASSRGLQKQPGSGFRCSSTFGFFLLPPS